MHLCGHSSVKLLWSCDARAQDSFPLFKSTQCFQNMFFYQFVHSSEPILGIWENFHNIHPLGVYTFFNKTLCFDKWILLQRKVGSYFFSTACWLFSRKIYFLFLFVFVVVVVFFLWGILLPKHVYIFVRYFCYIHAYPRYLAT